MSPTPDQAWFYLRPTAGVITQYRPFSVRKALSRHTVTPSRHHAVMEVSLPFDSKEHLRGIDVRRIEDLLLLRRRIAMDGLVTDQRHYSRRRLRHSQSR